MARAYGSSASLLLKRETVYGQKPKRYVNWQSWFYILN